MKSQITLLLIIGIISICKSQSQIDKKYFLSIEEVNLPLGDEFKYEYRNKKITVFKNGKRTCKVKLNDNEVKKLNLEIDKSEIFELKSIYSRPIIDGTNWTFKFEVENQTKEIRMDNYYLESLDILLRHINGLIPQKKAGISFGEDMHTKPDTLISYLPDFYFQEVELPNENYSSYNIMCFKKGYFVTTNLDEIELCECRIYPKNKKGTLKKRPYWRAFKKEDGNWLREFYNEKGENIRTENILNVVPQEIVKEEKFEDEGNKPSIKINRFTKTEIVEKK